MQARTLYMEQTAVQQVDWYAGGRLADLESSRVCSPRRINWPHPVESVASWLEQEDSALDLLCGYGLCGLGFLYVLGSLVRFICG